MKICEKEVNNHLIHKEQIFTSPAEKSYFIRLKIAALDKSGRYEQLFLTKGKSPTEKSKRFDYCDKVNKGETLEQAFKRVFFESYGLSDFKQITILSKRESDYNKEGISLPRYVLEVKVDRDQKFKKTLSGKYVHWFDLPSQKELLEKLAERKFPGIAFNPTQKKNVPQGASKFGGLPYYPADKPLPVCTVCGYDLIFVCQFAKSEFKEMRVPNDKSNFLLLFVCQNLDCSEWWFFKKPQNAIWVSKDQKPIEKFEYKNLPKDAQLPIECKANPMEIIDPVNLMNLDQYGLEDSYHQLDDDHQKIYWDKHQPFRGTKINGEPYWIQDRAYPTCDVCGKEMLFWGQVSSEEPLTEKLGRGSWSEHGMMFGDVGIIYLFYCEKWCSDTIKSVFQCS